MKIKDLVNEGVVGDFVSSFKQGYSSQGPSKGTVKKQFQKSSPYDIVRPQAMKEIIDLVLQGKQLSPQQQSLLKKLYNRL